MKESIARLSAQFSRLSSAERWFIILVIIVVFVVINLVFILPHAGDWNKLTKRMNTARKQLQKYEEAIGETGLLNSQIAKLEGQGAAVLQEDQAVKFLTDIQNQAVQSRVTIMANNPQPPRTNQFFLERAQSVRTVSNEEQLVDFLYNLGAGSSLIRVRALSLQPDPPRQALNATATLIASFQKKPTVRSAPAPAPTSAKKPEAATNTKTNTAKPTAAPAPAGASKPSPGAKPATPPK